MHCFFKFISFKRLVLSSVLCSFPLAIVTPPPNLWSINVNFNDINFGVKIQKLIDKAWKYYDKADGNNLLDVILDIKSAEVAISKFRQAIVKAFPI